MPSWKQFVAPWERKKKDIVPQRVKKIIGDSYPQDWDLDRQLGFADVLMNNSKYPSYAFSWIFYMSYIQSKRPTLFCDNDRLAQTVYNSKLQIDLSVIRDQSPFVYDNEDLEFIDRNGNSSRSKKIDQYGAYSVCWPDNFKINGKSIHPIFIGCANDHIYIEKRNGFFERDYIRVDNQHDFNVLMNEENLSEFKLSVQMALKLSIIAIMTPDLVEEGLPEGMKSRDRKNSVSGYRENVTLPIVARDTPSAHFRNCHFRTLNHERYKRDTNGLPRVVFVNSSIVGRAKTVKEKI